MVVIKHEFNKIQCNITYSTKKPNLHIPLFDLFLYKLLKNSNLMKDDYSVVCDKFIPLISLPG